MTTSAPQRAAEEFRAIDDELYWHEAPFYYKAARGMVHDDFSPSWYCRREALTKQWHEADLKLRAALREGPGKQRNESLKD